MSNVRPKRGRGNKSKYIDRELFHAWLWENRGRKDKIIMSQRVMSETLHCSIYTPTRILAELIAAGKVERLRTGMKVLDPADF